MLTYTTERNPMRDVILTVTDGERTLHATVVTAVQTACPACGGPTTVTNVEGVRARLAGKLADLAVLLRDTVQAAGGSAEAAQSVCEVLEDDPTVSWADAEDDRPVQVAELSPLWVWDGLPSRLDGQVTVTSDGVDVACVTASQTVAYGSAA